MQNEVCFDSTNRILSALSPETRRTVLAATTRLSVPRGERLYEVGASMAYVYFIENGMASLSKPMRDGRAVEIGAIGREGITPPTAVFGVASALVETTVQIPVTARRMRRDELRRMLASKDDLAALMEGYVAVVLGQLMQTAACNAIHSIKERCCRWLLLAHDSALGGDFPLTHEFLARLLCVRRAGISTAISGLEAAALIQNERGKISIRDRRGLERISCECYAEIRNRFDALFAQYAQRGLTDRANSAGAALRSL